MVDPACGQLAKTTRYPALPAAFSGHASAMSNPGTAAASSSECAHATSSS
jgi:hypothetical protein